MTRIALFFVFLIAGKAFAQEEAPLKMLTTQGMSNEEKLKLIDDITKDMLQPLIRSLYSQRSDEGRSKDNARLTDLFEQIINVPESFDYTFDTLKKDIGVLYSPDRKFRIVHWNIPNDDGTYSYHGFIQSKHHEVKKTGLFRKSSSEIGRASCRERV